MSLALLSSPLAAQGTAEAALAKATLNALQAKSFAANREYCGYIILTAQGQLEATKAVRGEMDSCMPPWVDDDAVILASYHTHGAFDYDIPAEFPSVMDIEADEDEGIDGYISTPGGRFWFVDSSALVVSQLCGLGCMISDPAFVAGLDGKIAQSYTYNDLLAREAE